MFTIGNIGEAYKKRIHFAINTKWIIERLLYWRLHRLFVYLSVFLLDSEFLYL